MKIVPVQSISFDSHILYHIWESHTRDRRKIFYDLEKKVPYFSWNFINKILDFSKKTWVFFSEKENDRCEYVDKNVEKWSFEGKNDRMFIKWAWKMWITFPSGEKRNWFGQQTSDKNYVNTKADKNKKDKKRLFC